ncbi:MAG: 6,7-dimethyl-8-ribityllumazine synthase [Candidatus Pelagibacterales bacterium]
MKKYKFLLVVSNFYPKITLDLLNGAQKYLEKNGHKFDTTFTKGSLEIPTKISMKLSKRKYDAVVAIGCIIKGKTDHYDFIANAITKTLLELSIQNKLPISNSVLTCRNIKQAKERSSKKLNRAKEAVEAAIAVLQE